MNGAQLSFPPDQVQRIYVDAQAGNDSVRNDVNRRSTLRGGDGNDTLIGGPASDFLYGEAGNDILKGEGGGNALIGGDGIDTADFSDRPEAYQFVIGRISDTPDAELRAANYSSTEGASTLDPIEIVSGTQFADSFDPSIAYENGTLYSVTLLGNGGNDTFKTAGNQGTWTEIGGPGNDYFAGGGPGIEANGAAPTLIGGHGKDFFYYDNDRAVIAGGPGIDTVDLVINKLAVINLARIGVENAIHFGASASQTIIGSDGPNYLNGGPGDYLPCTLIGNGGNDTLIGGTGDDYLSGGPGDDLIEGGGGNDTIFGGDGNDVLAGNSGNDKIHGGAGNDTIVGGTGRDRLYGDDGDDLLLALDHQRDTVYGGSGTDTASVDDSATVKDLWDQIETFL